MKKSAIAFSIAVVFTTVLPLSSSARSWNFINGAKPIEAEFVDYRVGMVILESPDKRRSTIPFDLFSPEDKQLVTQLKEQSTTVARTMAPSSNNTRGTQGSLPPVKGIPDTVAKMKPGMVFTQVARGETATTYHVYTPTNFDASKLPPIIIAFSPGGDGKSILNAVTPAAEKMGWLAVGCDKLSNELEKSPDLERKVEDDLMNDILTSLAYDPNRIYLAGFSGGAMRSYGLTNRRKNPFAGIIAYGGWLGGEKNQTLRYGKDMAVAMVNGRQDNAANSWAKKDAQVLKRFHCTIKEFPWDGGHAIPPNEITESAVLWLDAQWNTHNHVSQ